MNPNDFRPDRKFKMATWGFFAKKKFGLKSILGHYGHFLPKKISRQKTCIETLQMENWLIMMNPYDFQPNRTFKMAARGLSHKKMGTNL